VYRCVVGLGNPGLRYEYNRHNIGYRVIDNIVQRHNILVKKCQCDARTDILDLPGGRIVLVRPITYMNNSGHSVKLIKEAMNVGTSSILVVCDDLDLELGRIRLKRRGSSGGHRGVQSIIDSLEDDFFPRLRIGIGRPGEMDARDYVLSDFSEDEERVVSAAIEAATRAVLLWHRKGVEVVMSAFNGMTVPDMMKRYGR